MNTLGSPSLLVTAASHVAVLLLVFSLERYTEREWRVSPSMLKVAMPVGAATQTLLLSRSRRHCIKYNFLVPDIPETISQSGDGL